MVGPGVEQGFGPTEACLPALLLPVHCVNGVSQRHLDLAESIRGSGAARHESGRCPRPDRHVNNMGLAPDAGVDRLLNRRRFAA